MAGLGIKGLERGGDVLGEGEAEGIGGDAPDPPARRQAAQDEAEGGGNEGTDGEPADDLQGDHHVVVGGEGKQQRGQREDGAGPEHEAPDADHDAEPSRAGATIIWLAEKAVFSQEPSSKPRLSPPLMSASPKVVTRVFRVEMKAPISTAATPISGRGHSAAAAADVGARAPHRRDGHG